MLVKKKTSLRALPLSTQCMNITENHLTHMWGESSPPLYCPTHKGSNGEGGGVITTDVLLPTHFIPLLQWSLDLRDAWGDFAFFLWSTNILEDHL